MAKKDKKDSKDESLSFSNDERRKMIQNQLEDSIKRRDEYTTLIYKCQGALELLDSIKEENGKNND